MKYIQVFITIFLIILSSISMAEDKITINMAFVDIPPLWMKTTNNGYTLDIINKINLNSKFIRIKPIFYENWNIAFDEFKNGKVDSIFASGESEERKQYMVFTKPYVKLPIKLIARKDIQYFNTMVDLNNKSIGILKGSTLEEYFNSFNHNIKIKLFNNEKEAIAAVSFGDVDVIATEAARASIHMLDMHISNLSIKGSVDHSFDPCFGFLLKNQHLKDMVQNELIKIDNKDLEKMFSKYVSIFGIPLHKQPKFYYVLSVVLSICLLYMFIMTFKNKILKFKLLESLKEKEILAHTDFLTGLPNRRLCIKHIEELIKQDKPFSVFFIDLDRFKYINDTYGHTFGDKLLKLVGHMLQNGLIDIKYIYRIGGDEFIIINNNVVDKKFNKKIANNIIKILSEQFIIDDIELKISPSIGISVYPTDANTVDDMLTYADLAMYQAKNQGKNSYYFYEKNLMIKIAETVEIEQDLKNCLNKNQLFLNYQPQIHLKTNKVVGAEALLRWHHSEKGPISPAKFIPIAEDTGMILPIGDWIIEEACKTQRRFGENGVIIRLGINISSHQFEKKNLFEIIDNTIKKYFLDPTMIELELTESVLMTREEELFEIFNKFDKIGVKLSIDDFGTGYSNFGYIKKFPIDKIKIDKQFIDGIDKDEDDRILIKSIIKMSHELGLNVIAEGVETLSQIDFLKSIDCDEIQGYYFSKPLNEKGFIEFYSSFNK